MAALMKSTAGAVVVDDVGGPQYLSVSGVPGFPSSGLVLTSVQINRRESVQHIRTLGGAVYSYAFGELPGSAVVAGRIFLLNSCSGTTGSLGQMNSAYEGKRAYQGGLTFVGIGGASFQVVLTGLDLSAQSGPFPDAEFSMSFTIIPR